ncbi:S41 family peptidase [Plebeiibacterium sediminum]|uniref:Aspartyl protease family protein n=1 Tax=Plebeiibacterium sediminum TaxID=2992112 RepID=A0AAE3SF62_9BACT|nr:S41 family peptidase [Plebeiobacterium sediminum]MCW3787140.1 aspartyl protease family protein [Plebeiobacterium sediminum]
MKIPEKIGIGLCVVACVIIVITYINNLTNYKETIQWRNNTNCFTIPFETDRNGRILINTTVNEHTGLFLFDTGANYTCVNEKYVTSEDLYVGNHVISDVDGVKSEDDFYKMKHLGLGAVEFLHCKVTATDSTTWKHPLGCFYLQDSILGIIGDNIISKFIWDFDLNNKRVTVSSENDYCNSLADTIAIPLERVKKSMYIPIEINNQVKKLMLDFGFAGSLQITDSILFEQKYFKNKEYYEPSFGYLTHLEDEIHAYNFDFVNVKLGNQHFEKIKCTENCQSNLAGISLVWSFERVVLDYLHQKVYFISRRKDKSCPYTAETVSEQQYAFKKDVFTSKQFFEQTFNLVQKHSIKKNELNWDSIKTLVTDSIPKFRFNIDAYKALDYTVKLMNDSSSRFYFPNDSTNPIANHQVELPIIPNKMLAEDIAYIKVPDFTGNDSLNNLFANSIRNSLLHLDSSAVLKGLVVDLREKYYGPISSGVLGLSPLLRDSLIGFIVDNTDEYKPVYCSNVLRFGSEKVDSLGSYIPLQNKDIKVAILQNQENVGSVEFILSALRFQGVNSKVFGDGKYSPTIFCMSFSFTQTDANLLLASSYFCSYKGQDIKEVIEPDVFCPDSLSLDRAIDWIKEDLIAKGK